MRCAPQGKKHLHNMIDSYLNWTQTLDTKYSGLVWIIPAAEKLTCGASWVFLLDYVRVCRSRIRGSAS